MLSGLNYLPKISDKSFNAIIIKKIVKYHGYKSQHTDVLVRPFTFMLWNKPSRRLKCRDLNKLRSSCPVHICASDITVKPQLKRWHLKWPASWWFPQPVVRMQTKKTSKLRVTDFVWDYSHKGPVTRKMFPFITSSWTARMMACHLFERNQFPEPIFIYSQLDPLV